MNIPYVTFVTENIERNIKTPMPKHPVSPL